jgi:hypothetical protein
MLGVVIGHGSHDGTEQVQVPDGLPVEFFTDEGSGLAMVNLLALLGRDNPRYPMQTMKPGATVPNYMYEPFKAHEIEAITAFNQLPNTSEVLLVGTPSQPNTIYLCSTPDKCPKTGPHRCAGVFAKAFQEGWQRVQIMSCRVNVKKPQEYTMDMMGPNGQRTIAVNQEFHRWAMSFLAKPTEAQDKEWAGLSKQERIHHRAADAEMLEWSNCYDARERITGVKGNVTALAELVQKLDSDVQLRLLRDYPELHEFVEPHIPTSSEDVQDLNAFLREPNFRVQADEWYGQNPATLAHWLTDSRIAAWASGLRVMEMVNAGLPCDALVGVLRRLDPQTRAMVILNHERTRDLLAVHAPNGLT